MPQQKSSPKHNHDDLRRLWKQAEDAKRAGRWEEAERLHQTLMKRLPSRSAAHSRARDGYHEVQHLRKAYEKVIELIEEGDKEYKEGEFQRAFEKYEQAWNWAVHNGIGHLVSQEVNEKRDRAQEMAAIWQELEEATESARDLKEKGKIRQSLEVLNEVLNEIQPYNVDAEKIHPKIRKVYEWLKREHQQLVRELEKSDLENKVAELAGQSKWTKVAQLLESLPGNHPLRQEYHWVLDLSQELPLVHQAVSRGEWENALRILDDLLARYHNDPHLERERYQVCQRAGKHFLRKGQDAFLQHSFDQALDAFKQAEAFLERATIPSTSSGEILEAEHPSLILARQFTKWTRDLQKIAHASPSSVKDLQTLIDHAERLGSTMPDDDPNADAARSVLATIRSRLDSTWQRALETERILERAEQALDASQLKRADEQFERVVHDMMALEEQRQRAHEGRRRVEKRRQAYKRALDAANRPDASLEERLEAAKEAYRIWPYAPEMPDTLITLIKRAATTWADTDVERASRALHEVIELVGSHPELETLLDHIGLIPEVKGLLHTLEEFFTSQPKLSLDDATRIETWLRRINQLHGKLQGQHWPDADNLAAELEDAKVKLQQSLELVRRGERLRNEINTLMAKGQWKQAAKQLARADSEVSVLVPEALRDPVRGLYDEAERLKREFEELKEEYRQLANLKLDQMATMAAELEGRLHSFFYYLSPLQNSAQEHKWSLPHDIDRLRREAEKLGRHLTILQQLPEQPTPLDRFHRIRGVTGDPVFATLQTQIAEELRAWGHEELAAVERELHKSLGAIDWEHLSKRLTELKDIPVLNSETRTRIQERLREIERRRTQEQELQKWLDEAERRVEANRPRDALEAYHQILKRVSSVDDLPEEVIPLLQEFRETIWPTEADVFPLTKEAEVNKITKLITQINHGLRAHWVASLVNDILPESLRLARRIHLEGYRDSIANLNQYIDALDAAIEIHQRIGYVEENYRKLGEYWKKACEQIAQSIRRRLQEIDRLLAQANLEAAEQKFQEALEEFSTKFEQVAERLGSVDLGFFDENDYREYADAQTAKGELDAARSKIERVREQKQHVEETLEKVKEALTADTDDDDTISQADRLLSRLEIEELVPVLRDEVAYWRRQWKNRRIHRELVHFRECLVKWEQRFGELELVEEHEDVHRALQELLNEMRKQTVRFESWETFPERIRNHYDALETRVRERLHELNRRGQEHRRLMETLERGDFEGALPLIKSHPELEISHATVATLITQIVELQETILQLMTKLTASSLEAVREDLEHAHVLLMRVSRGKHALELQQPRLSDVEKAVYTGLTQLYAEELKHNQHLVDILHQLTQLEQHVASAERADQVSSTMVHQSKSLLREVESMLNEHEDHLATWHIVLNGLLRRLRDKVEILEQVRHRIEEIEGLQHEGQLDEAVARATTLEREYPHVKHVRLLAQELQTLSEQGRSLRLKIQALIRQGRFQEAHKRLYEFLEAPDLPKEVLSSFAYLERHLEEEEQKWATEQSARINNLILAEAFPQALDLCQQAFANSTNQTRRTFEQLQKRCVSEWADKLSHTLSSQLSLELIETVQAKLDSLSPVERRKLATALQNIQEQYIARELEHVEELIRDEMWSEARQRIEELLEFVKAWNLQQMYAGVYSLRARVHTAANEALHTRVMEGLQNARSREDLQYLLDIVEAEQHTRLIEVVQQHLKLYDETQQAIKACQQALRTGDYERARRELIVEQPAPTLRNQYEQWRTVVELWLQGRQLEKAQQWRDLMRHYEQLRESLIGLDTLLLERLERERQHSVAKMLTEYKERLRNALSQVPPDTRTMQRIAQELQDLPMEADLQVLAEQTSQVSETLDIVLAAVEGEENAWLAVRGAWERARQPLSEQIWQIVQERWEPVVTFLEHWHERKWEQAEEAWHRIPPPLRAWTAMQKARERQQKARSLHTRIHQLETSVYALLDKRPVPWPQIVAELEHVSPEVRGHTDFQKLHGTVIQALQKAIDQARAEHHFSEAIRFAHIWARIDPDTSHHVTLVNEIQDEWRTLLEEARREANKALQEWRLEDADRAVTRWKRLATDREDEHHQVQVFHEQLERAKQVLHDLEELLRQFQRRVAHQEWREARRLWEEMENQVANFSLPPTLDQVRRDIQLPLQQHLDQALQEQAFSEAYELTGLWERVGLGSDARQRTDTQVCAWIGEQTRRAQEMLDRWHIDEASRVVEQVHQLAARLPVRLQDVAPTEWQRLTEIEHACEEQRRQAAEIRRRFRQAWQLLVEVSTGQDRTETYIQAQRAFRDIAAEYTFQEAQRWQGTMEALIQSHEKSIDAKAMRDEEALRTFEGARGKLLSAREALASRPDEQTVALVPNISTWRRQMAWWVVRLDEDLQEIIRLQREIIDYSSKGLFSEAYDSLTRRDQAIESFRTRWQEGPIIEPPDHFEPWREERRVVTPAQEDIPPLQERDTRPEPSDVALAPEESLEAEKAAEDVSAQTLVEEMYEPVEETQPELFPAQPEPDTPPDKPEITPDAQGEPDKQPEGTGDVQISLTVPEPSEDQGEMKHEPTSKEPPPDNVAQHIRDRDKAPSPPEKRTEGDEELEMSLWDDAEEEIDDWFEDDRELPAYDDEE